MFSFSVEQQAFWLCSNKSWSKNWGQVEFVLGASLRHRLEKQMSINLSPMEKSGPLLDLEELRGCQMETRGCLKVVGRWRLRAWWNSDCDCQDSPRLHETLGRKVATAAKHRSHRDQLTRASAANPMFSWPHKKLRNIWHEDSNEFVASEYSACSRLFWYCNWSRFFLLGITTAYLCQAQTRASHILVLRVVTVVDAKNAIKNGAFDRIFNFISMWCLL